VKRFYLDTNVFLSRYASREKEHNSSTRLLDALERGWIRAITSPLTLIEVASMVRRSHEKSREKIRPVEAAGAFVRRILSPKNLGFVPMGGDMILRESTPPVRIPLQKSSLCSELYAKHLTNSSYETLRKNHGGD